MKKHALFAGGFVAVALAAGSSLAHDADALTVQVGAGQDTTVVSAFFPTTTRVKVGDTVTFRLMGSEAHTVTFLDDHHQHPAFAIPADDGTTDVLLNPQVAFPTRPPDGPVESFDGTGFVNSGIMFPGPTAPDAPPNDRLTVTFTKPGTYKYHCLLHPWMEGTVIVEPDAAAATPAHEELDRQAQQEVAPLLALAEALPDQRPDVRSEPGPNGTTIWYVHAGLLDMVTADPRAALFDFLPKGLTVTAGDTVVWSSPEFHTVTFAMRPPGPEFILTQPQEQGPPRLVLNPEVVATVKPDGVYDPTQYYNSGLIGPFTEAGHSWTLTFEEPGTYEYYCAVHRELGMEGTVTVLPR